MAPKLTARPNLDHLRSQAKTLLADLRAGKPSAARTFIEHLPTTKGMTPKQVQQAGLRLADAQSAIARKSGFANWPSLARHVDQLRQLEGQWAFRRLEVDGAEMAAAMIGHSHLLIDGDRFRMESPEATYEGVFTIDVEAEPSSIDIEFIEGPEAGNWSYGVYTLHGDELTICLGLTGAKRPERFATSPGSGHALEHLHRVSDARPSDVTGGTRLAKKVTGHDAAGPAADQIDESAFAVAMTPLLERLQGEWTPVSLITDGKPLAEAFLAYGSRTMIGNETKVVFGGQTMVHAKVRIDESTTPIAIDYLNIPNSSRGKKTITRGIFEWTGDQMRFCMAPSGQPRPSDFSCEAGSGRTFSQWKRKGI